MRASRWFRMALFPLLLIVAGFAACNNDDVSGTGGALARLEMDMPDTVRSGVPFDAGASAAAVGVENVHDGVVTVTLPAPLRITDVTASPGTSATFSNVGLATVTWTLRTLDSNTRSTITIYAAGTLPPGAGEQLLTAQAAMVADGISLGELVANDSFVLAP
ncbi:MAG: hypothetical protein ABW056_04900 [Thermoanaerobaculia bacterium]